MLNHHWKRQCCAEITLFNTEMLVESCEIPTCVFHFVGLNHYQTTMCCDQRMFPSFPLESSEIQHSRSFSFLICPKPANITKHVVIDQLFNEIQHLSFVNITISPSLKWPEDDLKWFSQAARWRLLDLMKGCSFNGSFPLKWSFYFSTMIQKSPKQIQKSPKQIQKS